MMINTNPYTLFLASTVFTLTTLFTSTLSAENSLEKDLALDAYAKRYLLAGKQTSNKYVSAKAIYQASSNILVAATPEFRQFIEKAESSSAPSLQKLNYQAERYRQKNFGAVKKQLTKELAYMQVMGFLAVSALYALPEETSGFNKENIRNTSIKNAYLKNIRSGPVRDTDSHFINYVVHPYWGSAYYTWGRSRGLSDYQSIALSTFMSTFFWEYGWEAIAETPSYQDLVLTPLVGSLLGRAGYKVLTKIEHSEGRLWGSKKLGSVAKVVINPLGSANDRINSFLRKMSSSSQVETSLLTGLAYTSSTSINLSAHGTSKASWKPKPSLLQLNIAFD